MQKVVLEKFLLENLYYFTLQYFLYINQLMIFFHIHESNAT